jgi:hypothetical protein
MTNYDKLVRWDADWYKSLSEDECIICLTEKQIYLIGQVLDQIAWSRTRWAGDKSGLDFKAILGELEYNLSNCNDICDLVADCVENDIDVQLAIELVIRELGFTNATTGNPDVPPQAPIGGVRMSGDMLPVDYDCSVSSKNMAVARSIVQSINVAITDWLEVIELITNPAELATEISDNVEGLSYVVGTSLEIAAWVQDTVAEFYSASYTESAEDEIACAIFCALEDNCTLSFQELIDIYADLAGEIIPDQDDLYAMVEFFITLGASIDTTTVAIIHLFVLHMMRFGGAFGWSGIGSFESDIRAWVQMDDFTYADCDCTTETPDTYWYLEANFEISSNGWFMQNGTGRDGGGIIGVSSGGNLRVTMRYPDLGASYTLEQFAVLNQRQATGGTPSGTDTDTSATWPNANYTGTVAQNGTQAFKSRDDNSVFGTWTGTVTGKRSFQFDSIFWQTTTERKFRMRRVAIWGLPASGAKPPGSVWVANLDTDIFSRGD